MGLFTPAWLKPNEQKALDSVRAVIRKDDQKTLSGIATQALTPAVRKLAVENLKDRALLVRIALSEQDDTVKSAAIMRIDDPEALEKLYYAEKTDYMRSDIVKRISDPTLLLKIARTDPDSSNRYLAFRRIKTDLDDATLKEFAITEQDAYHIIDEAIGEIKAQSCLSEIVTEMIRIGSAITKYENNYDPAARRELGKLEIPLSKARSALKRIADDQPLFAYVILQLKRSRQPDSSAYACIDISMKKLTDSSLLYQIVQDEAVDIVFRLSAAKKTAVPLTQEDNASLAMYCTDTLKSTDLLVKGCYAALEKVTDQGSLLKIVNHTKSMPIRILAMSRLEDTSGVIFWNDRESCEKHDNIRACWLPYLDVIDGKWRCPFCGEALLRCDYSHPVVHSEVIKSEDEPGEIDIRRFKLRYPIN